MAIEVTAVCDGNRCVSEKTLSLTDYQESERKEVLMHYGWLVDVDNDFCYCPHCVKKMEESGEI